MIHVAGRSPRQEDRGKEVVVFFIRSHRQPTIRTSVDGTSVRTWGDNGWSGISTMKDMLTYLRERMFWS